MSTRLKMTPRQNAIQLFKAKIVVPKYFCIEMDLGLKFKVLDNKNMDDIQMYNEPLLYNMTKIIIE